MFKKGDKVTYLGHPGEIIFVGIDQIGRTYYSVIYNAGNGRTKASNIYNKDGEIKILSEEGGTGTTASGGEYTSKYFLGKTNIDSYIKDGFTKVKNSKKHKTFDIMQFKEEIKHEILNEISYRRFNENVSQIAPERKITRALKEVKKHISEIEKVVEYSNRLKTENTVKKHFFWESKMDELDALSERLNNLAENIQKLSQ
jgi:hypothetical protein